MKVPGSGVHRDTLFIMYYYDVSTKESGNNVHVKMHNFLPKLSESCDEKVEYEVPGDIIWNNLISSTRVELQLSRSTIIWIALKIHYQFISRSPSFGPPFIDLPIVGSIFQIYGRPSTMYLNKEK